MIPSDPAGKAPSRRAEKEHPPSVEGGEQPGNPVAGDERRVPPAPTLSSWSHAPLALAVVGIAVLALGFLIGRRSTGAVHVASPGDRIGVDSPVHLAQPAADGTQAAPNGTPNVAPVAESRNPAPDTGGLSIGVVEPGSASLGEPAPAFSLRDLDGNTVALSHFAGRPVIVNFWATWCAPCRAEMPYLQAVEDRYRDRGLVVLAIDVEEPIEPVERFVEQLGLRMRVLLDEGGHTADLYKLRIFPTTYLIGTDGRIASIKRGAYRDQMELERAVVPLLEDAGSS